LGVDLRREGHQAAFAYFAGERRPLAGYQQTDLQLW